MKIAHDGFGVDVEEPAHVVKPALERREGLEVLHVAQVLAQVGGAVLVRQSVDLSSPPTPRTAGPASGSRMGKGA